MGVLLPPETQLVVLCLCCDVFRGMCFCCYARSTVVQGVATVLVS